MSTAVIKFYVEETPTSGPTVKVELEANGLGEKSKLLAWSRQAMIYASQVVEQHPFNHDLWQQDRGTTLTLTNETESEDRWGEIDLIEDDNTIGFELDVSANIGVIGGLNTPTVQVGNAVLEMLNMARERVSV